ncbi:hypothetical protein BGZ68_006080 [Mortierella alpina]|nr:hypothetical protein BGZ68_006080 [Mortierella alpina]
MSRFATLLDLQLLQESMAVDPPTESALMCARILESAPPSILTARMRIQLYRDPDNENAAFLGYDVCELLQSGPCCMSQWNGGRYRFEFPGEGHDHFNMPVLPYDHTERTHRHYVFVVMPVTMEGLVPSDKRIRMPEVWPRCEEESESYTRKQNFMKLHGSKTMDTIYFGLTCQKISDQCAGDLQRTLVEKAPNLLGTGLIMGRDECLALAKEMFRLSGYPVRETE